MNRLAQWRERLSTVPGLGRDIAAIVAVVALGLVAVVAIKSNLGGSYPWTKTTTVSAEFAQVPGLNPDTKVNVTIAGVKVGTVSHIVATNRDTAVVTMKLPGHYDFYQNARAVLQAINPLNEMQIELNQGSASAPALGSETIPVAQTARPVQADEILDHLDARSQQAITDLLIQSSVALRTAPQNLPGGLAATTDTLGTLQPVVAQLATRRTQIRALVTALSQISAAVGHNDAQATQLALSTSQTLATLARNDGALRASVAQLPGLTAQLRSALTSTQALTRQLNPTLSDLNAASQALPAALTRFRSTLSEVGKTVVAARPVLNKAVPVIADLRPTVANTEVSLRSLSPVASKLDADTRTVMSYLTDIKAFVYNTASVFGAGDANGSIIRGHLMVPLPDAGVLPNPNPARQGSK